MSIPVTKKNIIAAEQFLKRKWADRSLEYGKSNPKNLTGACKFAALFAQRIFGGTIHGNWYHVFVIKNGKTIDLTNGVGVEKVYLTADHPHFIRDPEFKRSLNFCEPRVKQWVTEFLMEERK